MQRFAWLLWGASHVAAAGGCWTVGLMFEPFLNDCWLWCIWLHAGASEDTALTST